MHTKTIINNNINNNSKNEAQIELSAILAPMSSKSLKFVQHLNITVDSLASPINFFLWEGLGEEANDLTVSD